MGLARDLEAKGSAYDAVQVGQVAQYQRVITDEDITEFAEVSGDYNPVHMDEDFAKNTIFKGKIAHGLLAASFISTVLANKLPGPGTIYLKQDLVFKNPVRVGDTITTTLEVINKEDQTRRITLKTTCLNQKNMVVVDGQALVTVV